MLRKGERVERERVLDERKRVLEEKENQDGKREIKQLGIGFYATSRVSLGIDKLILKKGQNHRYHAEKK